MSCGVRNLCFALLLVSMPLGIASAQEPKEVVDAFQENLKQYVKLRERLEDRLPKLSKEATPEEIEAHEVALRKLVQGARAEAKAGDLFSPDSAEVIRATIRSEFRGSDRPKLRETVLEADTKGVPLRVNQPYPEYKELTQIPPTLLLRLPELPEQVKYRFVGRYLLLVDAKNALILDYIPDALP
jgi:hypothetical protein